MNMQQFGFQKLRFGKQKLTCSSSNIHLVDKAGRMVYGAKANLVNAIFKLLKSCKTNIFKYHTTSCYETSF
jgi:hypothetical protein